MPSASLDQAKHRKAVLENTERFVKKKLSGEPTGHDWWHIDRVRKNALAIAAAENVDTFVVELAALLHDIADWKFHGGDTDAGPRAARQWLESQAVSEEIIVHVCEIVSTISFRGAGVQSPMGSAEGKVVQDGDRLDSIGAIAIARTFAYGGNKGRMIFDPEMPCRIHETFEQYKSSNGTSINHFYEKLLLLKDRLNTATAKKIAASRHAFMERFLEQFFAEWHGKS